MRSEILNKNNRLLEEQNTIVDEGDNVIGSKPRSEITHKDIYRVASLWVRNTKGQILLAQRAQTKSHDPGKWGPAVAGTVAEGEDYETNILREAEEELGLTGLKLEVGPKQLREGTWRYYSQTFNTTIDLDPKELKINRDEVAAVKWFDEANLAKEIKENPDLFIESMKRYISS